MLSHPVPASSPGLPTLGDRGIAYAVLALGLAGLLTELVSAVFLPRLVLYVMVLCFSLVGLVRGRRAGRRSAAAASLPR